MSTPERSEARKARTRTKEKGRLFELRVSHWLRNQGWVVDDDPRSRLVPLGGGRMFSSRHDILGCVDILAVGPLGVWFIQATSGGEVSQKRRELEGVPWPFSEAVRVSIFEHREERRHRPNGPPQTAQLARIHDYTPPHVNHVLSQGTWEVREVVTLSDSAKPPPPRKPRPPKTAPGLPHERESRERAGEGAGPVGVDSGASHGDAVGSDAS